MHVKGRKKDRGNVDEKEVIEKVKEALESFDIKPPYGAIKEGVIKLAYAHNSNFKE